MNQPVRTPRDVGERAVPAVEIELYGPNPLGEAGGALGFDRHYAYAVDVD